MGDDGVISMAEKCGDGKLQSPRQVLEEALSYVGEVGAFRGKKLLILALDEGEQGGQYDLSFIQAGMSMSQCISLCEVSKAMFIEEMII